MTVTELQTLTAPHWLFEFIDEQSQQSVRCILDNISQSTSRYDEFQITDGVDVTFPYAGFYTYRIYEQTSDSNLDPALAGSLCEEGRAHIFEVFPSDNEYDQPLTNYIYE